MAFPKSKYANSNCLMTEKTHYFDQYVPHHC